MDAYSQQLWEENGRLFLSKKPSTRVAYRRLGKKRNGRAWRERENEVPFSSEANHLEKSRDKREKGG